MKKDLPTVEKQVMATLQVLETMAPATCGPGFEEKVLQRMRKPHRSGPSRLLLAAAFLLLALNVLAVLRAPRHTMESTDDPISMLACEYSLLPDGCTYQ